MIVSLKAYGEMLAICMHIISNECVDSWLFINVSDAGISVFDNDVDDCVDRFCWINNIYSENLFKSLWIYNDYFIVVQTFVDYTKYC